MVFCKKNTKTKTASCKMTPNEADNNSTDCYVSDKNRCRVKTLKTKSSKSTIAKGTKQNTKKHSPPRTLQESAKKKPVLPENWIWSERRPTGKRLELLQKHYELWVEVRDRGILLHDFDEHYMVSPADWGYSPLSPSMTLKDMKMWLRVAREDFIFRKKYEKNTIK